MLFSGARWWKFDFHTHTPASSDFSDKDQMEPELWLKKFMEEKIDCVTITDHNSGGWIDCLKQKLQELEENRPEWYHPLYLFPGVEISTYDDVHLLAIFGSDKDESHIDHLLGAVGYNGTKGKSDGVTKENIIEVISEIIKHDGIPIPAHVDKGKGLFQLSGKRLQDVLNEKDIYAIELRDSGYEKPQLYKDVKFRWTEVVGSDTHGFDDGKFGTFTWIKMDNPPSIEGLRLALIDGTASVSRDMNVNPNDHAECFMEKIEISNAKYMGRAEPLKCQFSPFLSTIIGGRGSGKSTLLEFMRLVLERDQDQDIPKALRQESRRYFDVEADDSVLTKDSKISLIYHKGEVCYRLNWSADGNCTLLEEKKNGNWDSCPGEIRSLFPVYIYSQKQIFEFAKDPRALISIIDNSPEVDFKTIHAHRRDLINQYKQIEAEQMRLGEKIDMENQLRGELNDLVNQIEHIEKSGHREVLQNYRNRQHQLNELNNLESRWEKMKDQLLEMKDGIVPANFNKQNFSEDSDILSVLEAENKKWYDLHAKLSELSQEAESIIANWDVEKSEGGWMKALTDDMAQYEQLHSGFEQQGIDPDKYPSLLRKLKSIQKDILLIKEHQVRYQELGSEKEGVFKQIEENRKELTEKRRNFLSRVLQNNEFVSIEIVPFGDNWDGIEKEIRDILNCEGRFSRDIDSLKKSYHHGNANDRVEVLKKKIRQIRDGEETPEDSRFATYLKSLPQESMSDLALWFPGDNLKVTFSTDGGNTQRIEEGSPGQKTAALLAFILSYGDEPLLLDQPEDDLDNKLIYNLIVKQLRATKNKRQVIVVTHNANIVVNGDAEMVLPLEAAGGETRVRQAASIQESEVRQAICNILEGGQHAFEQRYKRIHLEI